MRCGGCNQNGCLYSWGAYFVCYPDFMVCLKLFCVVLPVGYCEVVSMHVRFLPVYAIVKLCTCST